MIIIERGSDGKLNENVTLTPAQIQKVKEINELLKNGDKILSLEEKVALMQEALDELIMGGMGGF